MRKPLASFLAAASLLSISSAAFAQAPSANLAAVTVDDPGPQDTITINPLWALVQVPNLAYERAIGRHASIMVAGLHASLNGDSDGHMSNLTISELTFQPHFYFFGDRALEGLYLAPFIEVVDASTSDTAGNLATGTGVALGATVGWSWLLGPANIKLGVGGQVATASAHEVNADGSSSAATGAGAGLALDLACGFAF
jgi:hypothetical protein